MSKSGGGGSCIFLDDSDTEIRAKVRKAVTETVSVDAPVTYDEEGRPGLANLLRIQSLCEGGTPMDSVLGRFSGSGVGMEAIKESVSTSIIRRMEGIREQYAAISESQCSRIVAEGRERAEQLLDYNNLIKIQN